ncbi:MAG: hypothetical protein J5767_01700 [Paludibacteraceae bacterium]|nr:hypothetical protein [Paludibacteraceae bacterium]
MKMVNKLRFFLIPIIGLVSISSSFAYDDIYESAKKGGQEYAQKTKQHSQGKADANAQKEIDKQRNMIIIKSPNVERYDLVSNEFIAVIDTTLKKDDAYVLDTIRIMDEFGDLEKTLMLKTKGKQNVYFDNGAIVIEDSASVASGNFVTDTLVSVDNGDYEYTKRLNKYHGTDYNVVSVDDNNAAETSVESSNTTVYVGLGYPYHRYYGWWSYPYYTGYYDPYWGYYDPYWGYYGYYGYYSPYRYSYYYHPYHHYYWHAPIYHYGHGGRYSASNGSYGKGRTDGTRVSRGSSSPTRSVAGTRTIERSSTRSATTGRTTTLSRAQGSSSRPSASTSSTTLRRSASPSSSSSARTSSGNSRSYSSGSSVRGNSSGSSSSYSGRSSYSAPRSSGSSTRSSGSSSSRSSSYGSYSGSSRSSGSSSSGSYSSGSSRSGGYSSGSSNSGSRSSGGGSSSSRGGSHSGGGRR